MFTAFLGRKLKASGSNPEAPSKKAAKTDGEESMAVTEGLDLAEEDCDQKSHGKLLLEVAALTLQASLAAKIAQMCTIKVYLSVLVQVLVTECKSSTQLLSKRVKELPEHKRYLAPPPHVVKWDTMIVVTTRLTEPGQPTENPELNAACKGYQSEVLKMEESERIEYLSDAVKYIVVDRAFKANQMKILMCLHGAKELSLWALIEKWMKEHYKLHRRYGIAPKTKRERFIEAALKKAGVWKSQSGEGTKGSQ